MPRCLNCKTKFTPKTFLQKHCLETDECLSAFMIYKDEKIKENNAKKIKAKITENQKAKIDLLSDDAFRSKKIQPVINEIARLIDFEQNCIATDRNRGKMAGGHFISVGANRASCMNLHNIHIQSYESNGPSGGDPLLYREGLIRIYGLRYCEFIESMRQIPKLGLKRHELEEIFIRAKRFRLELKKTVERLNPAERIEKRNEANEYINAYERKYSVFK